MLSTVAGPSAGALTEKGLASVELGKKRDEFDSGIALANRHEFDAGEERVVRQPGRGGEDVFVHDCV